MSRIPFDTVLQRADTDEVVDALRELERPRRLSGRGVAQSRDELRQFAFAADEVGEWWTIAFEDGRHERYRDGTYAFRDGRNDEQVPGGFFNPLPLVLQMLWPTRILTWANPAGSFFPMLAQPLGRHSILFTFEHIEDPAYRQTLVVDARSGIATKLVGLDHALVITSIDPLDRWNPDTTPAFEPIIGPISSDY